MAELEKNLLDNKKLEISEKDVDENNEEMKKKLKEQEEENRKFKEYREQQLKLSEEMDLKLKKLEEEKNKEEESLKNDVNKLQNKIKELNSEIEDLKLDNSKDRTDYMEGVRAIYRNNQFYREIIRYMLSDEELKKIIELSKYNEEDEKWDVHSFSLEEKSLALPSVKLGLGGGFGTNGFGGQKKNGGNKQIIFQNYGNENNNNNNNDENHYNNDEDFDYNEQKIMEMKNSKKNKELSRYDDQINNRINFRMSKDKIVVDGKRQAKSQVPLGRNISGTQKSFYNKGNVEEINNINRILMNQKEREKYEGLTNGGANNQLLNPLYVSASNPSNLFLSGNKHKKVMLNPLGSNGNKLEVSFKATVEINNKMPPIIGNKKLKLAQIQEKEYDD